MGGGGRKSISQRKKSMRETVTRMTKMLRGGNGGDGIADTDDMGKPIDPSKVFIKPDDQLELTEEELKVEHTRILTAKNPHAPDNRITFDFATSAFKEGPPIQHIEINYKQTGTLMHEDTDEAQHQLWEEQQAQIEESQSNSTVASQLSQKASALSQSSAAAAKSSQSVKSAVTSQAEIGSSVSQWEIYDYYQKHLQQVQAEKEKANTKGSKADSKKKNKKSEEGDKKQTDITPITAKKVDRMLNQNTYTHLADDFKYFDDPNDGPDKQEGSLLPLWHFDYEKAKRLAVTSMAWCPGTDENDLIVV